jgi:hypothetical protein
MTTPLRLTVLLTVALLNSPSNQADDLAEKITVSIELTEDTYDPTRPSDAKVQCVVRNNTTEPIEVPVAYDGEAVKLTSGSMWLWNRRSRGSDQPDSNVAPQTMKVVPGMEQLIFELLLHDILGPTEEWSWDWPRRPEPPRSPIHKWRAVGFKEQATFLAKVKLGEAEFQSNEVVLAVKAADAEDDDSWSKAVNGLQARLGFASKETLNGTPIITTYLELRNVSEVANVMEIPLDLEEIEFTVTDASGKEVRPSNGPFDGTSVELGVLRLPFDSSLRFNIASRGAGVPKDQGGLLDLGPSANWVFKRGEDQDYFLATKFVVEASAEGRWSGTIAIPRTRILVPR